MEFLTMNASLYQGIDLLASGLHSVMLKGTDKVRSVRMEERDNIYPFLALELLLYGTHCTLFEESSQDKAY